MGMFKRDPAPYHLAALRHLFVQAHHDSNVALQQLSVERRHARQLLTAAPFRYVTLATGEFPPAARTIAAPLFQRQYGLCLHTLELTLYGYCVERRFGWERRPENTFTTRVPLRWRRPPLLALTLRVCPGTTDIDLSAAGAGATASRAALMVRLDADLGDELAALHRTAAMRARAPRLAARLLAWLRRLVQGVRNGHAATGSRP